MTKPEDIGSRALIKETIQEMFQQGFDDKYNVLGFQLYGEDGQNLRRIPSQTMAMKMTESGDNTYIAVAAPGTAQATAKWRVFKIDESSGLVITWADGDTKFDNVATDLTSLSYS